MVPGGVLLLGVVLLLQFGWLTLALPALGFLYYCALIGGMLLAWRFHSSRIFFAIAVLALAHEGVTLSAGSHFLSGTGGWTVLAASSFLVPLNFVLISWINEREISRSGITSLCLLLFVQGTIVAVLARSAEESTRSVHPHHVAIAAVSLPDYSFIMFGVVGLVLLARAALSRKPADGAIFWSMIAFLLSLYSADSPRLSTAYAAVSMCILFTSIIETSYLLAYHDELTTLPSRRAFNDCLHRLQDPYSIAAVDIDHFKRFNDTYGHDTGDQVLRLVAGNLARVTGGGQAYRCGGEEFVILFPGKTLPEVLEHLERLRAAIEASEFHMRGGDRRQTPRGPDRRNQRRAGRVRKGYAIRQLAKDKPAASLGVTVSIGIASSSADQSLPDRVLEAADKALYRAKDNGRNRVEISSPPRRRGDRAKAAGIA